MKLFLTLNDFLKHFTINDITNSKLSKEQFEKQLIVTYNESMTLHEINTFKLRKRNSKPVFEMKTNDPRFIKREQILNSLYDIIIVNKARYLQRFYESYFPIVNPFVLDWETVDLNVSSKYNNKWGITTSETVNETKTETYLSVQLNDNSRKLIRNMFYLELLDKTKIINTIKSNESFWFALTDIFNNLRLQDRFFAKSSLDLIMRKNKEGEHTQTFFYLFQSYLPKASILNPYSIKWIIDNKLTPLLPLEIQNSPNKTLFSPVMSWCSYQIAFFHLNDTWENYIGVDVMPTVCKKSLLLTQSYYQMVPELKHKKHIKIICKPSEELYGKNGNGILPTKYKETIDMIIACFPYFNMEEYGEGEQSTKNYPNYSDWLEKYVEPTIKLCATLLKKCGIFAYITNNYSTLNGIYYNLKRDFKNICLNKLQSSCGKLEYKEEYMLMNRTSPLRTVKKDRIETMYVFQKS